MRQENEISLIIHIKNYIELLSLVILKSWRDYFNFLLFFICIFLISASILYLEKKLFLKSNIRGEKPHNVHEKPKSKY
jgi:nucleoside recognition membrane protein YjiH